MTETHLPDYARCPVCGGHDGSFSVGAYAADYAVCDTCRLRWCVQVGGHRDEPLDEWEQRAMEYPEIDWDTAKRIAELAERRTVDAS
jgi:hypothetical protein